ncbi:MAG: hypothetical protein RMX96_31250 [Nostoc sp. ChiSLP02]|nr:hypothetical protein [Nostoc sp. DedSLP05]MDZ8100718.1 hypothetical protein [Nostoc sp. DedSLP01]MDZ8189303.1 hypothetical protein [Nostoc sp. ChiSLP02]
MSLQISSYTLHHSNLLASGEVKSSVVSRAANAFWMAAQTQEQCDFVG